VSREERAGEIFVSHPTGNANVAAVVTALLESEMLGGYATCIHWRPESVWAPLVPAGLRRTLERRARLTVPDDKLFTLPVRELLRHLLPKMKLGSLTRGYGAPFSVDGVYHDLDRYAAWVMEWQRKKQVPLKAVYAYEDGALEQFRAAERLGMKRIYDLPIGYWRASREIAEQERELLPGWAGTLNALADPAEKLARKDEELAAADVVVAPSQFVARTLEKFPGKKRVVVNPFGVPARVAPERAKRQPGEPLRVLYVGGLTQRKGVAYLLQAVRETGTAVQLTMIGRKVGTSTERDRACEQHRWIESLPHAEILAAMREHDVFVFPSLFEGLALVLGEAISQGLPVITTPNSGGEDILRDGVDGFIVPIRDPHAIAEKLLLLAGDSELLRQMSENARARAAELTWKGYQNRTVALVRETNG
jgi:alpha-maltose-1-phosphate synthase